MGTEEMPCVSFWADYPLFLCDTSVPAIPSPLSLRLPPSPYPISERPGCLRPPIHINDFDKHFLRVRLRTFAWTGAPARSSPPTYENEIQDLIRAPVPSERATADYVLSKFHSERSGGTPGAGLIRK